MSDGKGGFFYVYCAQHGKRTTNGAGYDIVNVDESGYLYRENANHIQYIVENGWWDTDTGVGSLANVKKLVSEDKRDQIDPKQDVFTKAWTTGRGENYTDLTATQRAAAMELFNALIQQDKTNEEMADRVKQTTDLIHKDDIASTSIQAVEKVDVKSADELTDLVKKSLGSADPETDDTEAKKQQMS